MYHVKIPWRTAGDVGQTTETQNEKGKHYSKIIVCPQAPTDKNKHQVT